jgi:hypothetical protein
LTNKSEVRTFTIADTIKPNITNAVTTPALPVFNNGSEQTITANFTSNEFPINVTITIYNATPTGVNTTQTVNVSSASDLPVSFTIPNNLADGVYTVNLTATDPSSNSVDTYLGNFTVDTSAPSITNANTTPTLPTVQNTNGGNLSVNFTSNEFPINATFNLYNSTGSVVNTLGVFTLNNSGELPLNYSVPSGLTQGNYTLYLNVLDQAGNENVTNLGTIQIDTTAPTFTTFVATPRNVVTGKNISLGLSASDNVAVDSLFANITLPNGTTITFSLNNTYTTVIEGRHNVTFWANDTAGNVARD